MINKLFAVVHHQEKPDLDDMRVTTFLVTAAEGDHEELAAKWQKNHKDESVQKGNLYPIEPKKPNVTVIKSNEKM